MEIKIKKKLQIFSFACQRKKLQFATVIKKKK